MSSLFFYFASVSIFDFHHDYVTIFDFHLISFSIFDSQYQDMKLFFMLHGRNRILGHNPFRYWPEPERDGRNAEVPAGILNLIKYN